MTYSSNIIFTYQQDELTESHTVQKYPLGFMATMEDPDTPFESILMYVQADGSGCTKYRPYQTLGSFIVAPPQDQITNIKIVCPQFDFGPNEFGFALYKGKGKGDVQSSDGAASGDYIRTSSIIDYSFVDNGDVITNWMYGWLLESIPIGFQLEVDICLIGKEGQIS